MRDDWMGCIQDNLAYTSKNLSRVTFVKTTHFVYSKTNSKNAYQITSHPQCVLMMGDTLIQEERLVKRKKKDGKMGEKDDR